MKILLVMSLASPWSREVAIGLQELGHDVHVVDFVREASAAAYLRSGDSILVDETRRLEQSGVSIHRLRSRLRSTLRYAFAASALGRLVRAVSPDISVSLYGGGQALMLWLSGARPFAVYVVGSDVLMSRGPARWLSRRVLAESDHVFANGRHLAIATQRLSPSARIESLYLGVRTEDFEPAHQDTEAPRMICTRGFLPVYNNEYVLEGLAALNASSPLPTTFVSKGPGLERAKATADALLSPAQRQSVLFLGGVPTAVLRRELASSQIYISLSRSDGTSVSLLEALASGLTPVLSDIPQNREWVSEEQGNGILVPLDQPDQLASALRRVMADRALRVHAFEVNRRLVRERADSSTNLQRLAATLQAIATSNSSPRFT